MSTETDTTSEVARVLIEHTRIDGIHGDCSCGHVVPLGHSFAAHQAAMLAEAGLLHPAGTDHLAEDLRENTEALTVARAQLARLTEKRAAECIGNAFSTWATDATVRDAAHRVVAMVHAEPREAQIAAQEPTGGTQGGSGDSRASGGLDGSPDAVLESTPDLSVFTESTLLHDIARLEQERDGARIKGAQWKARYEEARDANRRVQVLAQWFQDQGQVGYARKVEEAVAGTAPEPATENPFRMPEDRS